MRFSNDDCRHRLRTPRRRRDRHRVGRADTEAAWARWRGAL